MSNQLRVGLASLVTAGALLVGTTAPSWAATNTQNGLINVNLQNLALAIPVSVAVPVSVAANVCGVSVLSLKNSTSCTATSTSQALSRALAKALAG